MGVNRTQFKKIINVIDQKRLTNQQVHYKRKTRLYNDFPELQRIDERIAALSTGATRKVLEAPDKRTSIMASLQKEIDKLSDKKSAILAQADYPADYLKPIYDCKNCQDTGFIEGERCQCLKREILKYAYGQSNLGRVLAQENFDRFSLDFYSSQSSGPDKESPREVANLNYKTCYEFALNFGHEFNNLILYGQAGLGKTFLCNCIAKEVLDQGFTVIYLTAFHLFKMIENYRFHSNEDLVSYDDIQAIYDCDLLIVDDLGTEINNAFTTSELFSLINNRLLDEKAIVISTNLDPKGWTNHYSDRIVSRIIGHYLSLEFIGTDIRLQKKFG